MNHVVVMNNDYFNKTITYHDCLGSFSTTGTVIVVFDYGVVEEIYIVNIVNRKSTSLTYQFENVKITKSNPLVRI